MRYEDLPVALRSRVDAQIGAPSKRRRGKGGGSSSGHASWKCATCGEVFTTWASVDRHDLTHCRIDCILSRSS